MLNERQKTVLLLHSQGKNNRQIAEETGINLRTVPDALKRAKSNLDKSIENVKFAIKNDLLADEQVVAFKIMLETM